MNWLFESENAHLEISQAFFTNQIGLNFAATQPNSNTESLYGKRKEVGSTNKINCLLVEQ